MRMDLESRKASIIDTTMKVTSEVGLDVMTVNQVAKRAGISEALIFKYFNSKEQLLKECYFAAGKMFTDFVNQFEPLKECDPEAAGKYLHDLWEACFNYCVELDYRVMYFMQYRESKYYYEIEEESREFFGKELYKFYGFFKKVDAIFHTDWEDAGRLTMVYGLGLTFVFLKRIVAGRIENTQEVRDMLWKLQWHGFSGGLA